MKPKHSYALYTISRTYPPHAVQDERLWRVRVRASEGQRSSNYALVVVTQEELSVGGGVAVGAAGG